ncbi:hypothetical protein BD626DRAFT_503195 [Schizophyllum amplum]|uniref:Uncharacterized protein n=1 Tax=Schizophyllum amplum TaxID=97359 RepID=A0A550C7Z3_9AGAR|nr:hypothetical protein BD626DRAFT_503195 [Auriculariopsis ampla]
MTLPPSLCSALLLCSPKTDALPCPKLRPSLLAPTVSTQGQTYTVLQSERIRLDVQGAYA